MTGHGNGNSIGSGLPSAEHLSREEAWRMLSLCLREPARPVDDLIDRLGEDDGAAWLQAGLRRHGVASALEGRLVNGRATLAELSSLKEAAKTTAVEAASKDDALAALAAYCLCVAAALLLHGVLISTQQRDTWDQLFVDLADAVPEPWSRLLLDAAATR